MRLATCSCERRRSLAERTSTSEVFIDLVVFQILALNATFHLNSYIWNLNKPVWQLCMSTQYQRLVLQNQVIKKHHVFFGILLNNTFVPSIYCIYFFIYIYTNDYIFLTMPTNSQILWCSEATYNGTIQLHVAIPELLHLQLPALNYHQKDLTFPPFPPSQKENMTIDIQMPCLTAG